MISSELFTDIVNESPRAEFINQMNLIKNAHRKVAVNWSLRPLLSKIPPDAKKRIWTWMKANPGKTGLIGGTAAGIGSVAGATAINRIGQETSGLAADPVIKALKNPSKMNAAQRLNTGIGAGAALAGGAGVYALLNKVPGIKRRPLLKAILATLGATATGYTAWRASDNYQKS